MTSRSKGNPFAQAKQYWKVTFALPESAITLAENGFEDMALAVSHFEIDEKKKTWSCELLFGAAPDEAELQRRLLVLSAVCAMPVPAYEIQQVQQQDWLAQVARSFPPLAIGRFYVHGSHAAQNLPPGSIPIRVDAGAAFGSGEHGTTRCCLEAIDWLARQHNFTNVLDMGCGSGILAIAASKMWNAPVLAVDIDPIAVKVTQENAMINRAQRVTASVSDGYASERVKKNGPYDLILSNILARPLVKFAPMLERHLSANGVAVLSGLLASQEAQVRSAHQMQGLTLARRFSGGEWCTLVMTR